MSFSGHNYIALTAHVFKEYVCDWIELVIESYMLHLSTLNGRLTTFYPYFLLDENANECDEANHDDLFPQILRQAKQS